jgi:type VI secretion system protein VasJ
MATTGGGGGDDPRAKKLKEARALAARRQLAEAIAMLQKEAAAATSRRDRFRWKLDLARVCFEGGKATLALPLLESLDGDAQKFMLDEWEPELSADVVKLMWECYRSAGDPEKAKKVYARLSSLDVTAALALDGNR